MIENYVGARRSTPLHAPSQQNAAVKNTLENMDMQTDAAASSEVQPSEVPRSEEFTISVEQVREHFRAKGVRKSKDTVQRWCRTGELTCQKRGVLNRYFTTETSLKKLEAKLLPDMIAETAGEKNRMQAGLPQDAAASSGAQSRTQLQTAEDAPARTSTQESTAAAQQKRADASTVIPHAEGDFSRLQAENEGLRVQLASKNDEIDFLREEVRAARDQRGAVVQISNRMLETLETMAVGGRLERTTPTPTPSPETVPATPMQSDRGKV